MPKRKRAAAPKRQSAVVHYAILVHESQSTFTDGVAVAIADYTKAIMTPVILGAAFDVPATTNQAVLLGSKICNLLIEHEERVAKKTRSGT